MDEWEELIKFNTSPVEFLSQIETEGEGQKVQGLMMMTLDQVVVEPVEEERQVGECASFLLYQYL